jgi:hypothetical protein
MTTAKKRGPHPYIHFTPKANELRKMVRELLQSSQVDGEKIAEMEQKMELLSLDNQQKMEQLSLDSQELRGIVDDLGQTAELGLEGIKNAVAQVSQMRQQGVLWVKCVYSPWYTIPLAPPPSPAQLAPALFS